MTMTTSKDPVLDVVIIGGGLSGLVVARGLQQQPSKWKLLEARSELGGRLRNDSKGHTIDLGGAWIWPDHQPLVQRLVKSLQIPTFAQPGDASSTRLEGGAFAMIEKISKALPNENICTAKPVTKLTKVADDDSTSVIRVDTIDGDSYFAKRVVVAVPPRLIAKHITFDPPLSPAKQLAHESSHTWMAGVTKVSLVYETKFWDDHLANTGFSSRGPAFQMYDASTRDERVSALTCFCLRTTTDRDEFLYQLTTQIAMAWMRWFGSGVDFRKRLRKYQDVHIQHWPGEAFISEDEHPLQIQPHPHPVAALAKQEWDGSLLFAGSESDQRSPGVMEGAIGAALRVLKELQDDT